MIEGTIVRADLEGLIWLVIIAGSIISQIAKAAKKAKEQPSAEPDDEVPRPLRASQAQQELRQFLQNLAEQQAPPSSTPTPPPVQQAARVVPQQAPLPPPPPQVRRATVMPRRTVARPAPQRVQPRQPAPAAPRKRPVSQDAPAPAAPPRPDATQRLIGDLTDPESLRAAIVAREILGPPVALRS